MDKLLNLQELAIRHKVSSPTVRNWLSKGLPYIQSPSDGGKEWVFCQMATDEWVENIENEKVERAKLKQLEVEAQEERDEDLKKKKLEKLEEEIQWIRLRREQRERTLVPIAEVEAIFEEQILSLKSQLQAAPSKWAHLLHKENNPATIKEVLTREVDDILKELSSEDAMKELEEYDPSRQTQTG